MAKPRHLPLYHYADQEFVKGFSRTLIILALKQLRRSLCQMEYLRSKILTPNNSPRRVWEKFEGWKSISTSCGIRTWVILSLWPLEFDNDVKTKVVGSFLNMVIYFYFRMQQGGWGPVRHGHLKPEAENRSFISTKKERKKIQKNSSSHNNNVISIFFRLQVQLCFFYFCSSNKNKSK